MVTQQLIHVPANLGGATVGRVDVVIIGDATVPTENVVIRWMQLSRTVWVVAHKEYLEHDFWGEQTSSLSFNFFVTT